MTVSNLTQARFLFVDDDPSFLDFLRQTFGEFSRGAWEMQFVTDAAQALDLLRRQPVDLAVLDLQMPGVDGLQLLHSLARDHPALQTAFLTGKGDERSRLAGLEGGAAVFLEKPAGLAGMESLFATLNELARWQQQMGGRGVLRRAGLLDLVKMECQSGNSRLFEVFDPEGLGRIWIKAGAIIHAITEERRGRSAFMHLVSRHDAEFHLKEFVEPPERSIERPWESLILEAARAQEQSLKSPQVSVAGIPSAAPLSPPGPEKLSPIKLPSQPAPGTTGLAAPVAPSPPRAEPAFAPATWAPEPAEAGTGLHIEEMIVCSDQREILYAWQCAETQKRLGWMDFISHKARQLGQGLPLGKFDRLELQSASGRIVARWLDSRSVLVCSNTKIQPPTGADSTANSTITDWFSRLTNVAGVLAGGGALADRKISAQSFSREFPAETLNSAWPCVADTFDAAQRQHFPAWQLRWIYEHAQLYCVRRTDDAWFAVLSRKEPSAVDLPAVERLFHDFQGLHAK